MIGPATFRFLNREHQCAGPDFWRPAHLPHLWWYNLHYFDDLNAVGAERRADWHRSLITRWIADNPAVTQPAWEPYPTSLRIVNWGKWHLGGHCLSTHAIHSLAIQARAVRLNIEHWLGRSNHLIANAAALVFAGCLFSGTEGDRWLRSGAKLLKEQIRSQVLPDGGHVERSPMYHAAVLQHVLDSVSVLGTMAPARASVLVDELSATAGRMVAWLQSMCHPDGDISFFHDAALDVTPTTAQLTQYAKRLGICGRNHACNDRLSLHRLPASGYIRMEAPRAVAIADVGTIGLGDQPGHSHACALSFELSLDGRRVFVNSGTSVYDAGHERSRQRGTCAHNTACVDGLDSSEVWGVFRVARRAIVWVDRSAVTAAAVEVIASHGGYVRRGIGVIHRRRIRLTVGDLEIEDSFQGDGVHDYVTAVHLAPGLTAITSDAARICIIRADGSLLGVLETSNPAVSTVEPSTYHPEFGSSIVNQKIVTRARRTCPFVIRQTIRWE